MRNSIFFLPSTAVCTHCPECCHWPVCTLVCDLNLAWVSNSFPHVSQGIGSLSFIPKKISTCNLLDTKNTFRIDICRSPVVSYYNLSFSVCLSVPHLLQHLWTDRDQTWQDGRGRVWAEPKGIGFHGNLHVVMATKKRLFLWPDYRIKHCLRRHGWRHNVNDVMNDVTLAVTSWMTSPW